MYMNIKIYVHKNDNTYIIHLNTNLYKHLYFDYNKKEVEVFLLCTINIEKVG